MVFGDNQVDMEEEEWYDTRRPSESFSEFHVQNPVGGPDEAGNQDTNYDCNMYNLENVDIEGEDLFGSPLHTKTSFNPSLDDYGPTGEASNDDGRVETSGEAAPAHQGTGNNNISTSTAFVGLDTQNEYTTDAATPAQQPMAAPSFTLDLPFGELIVPQQPEPVSNEDNNDGSNLVNPGPAEPNTMPSALNNSQIGELPDFQNAVDQPMYGGSRGRLDLNNILPMPAPELNTAPATLNGDQTSCLPDGLYDVRQPSMYPSNGYSMPGPAYPSVASMEYGNAGNDFVQQPLNPPTLAQSGMPYPSNAPLQSPLQLQSGIQPTNMASMPQTYSSDAYANTSWAPSQQLNPPPTQAQLPHLANGQMSPGNVLQAYNNVQEFQVSGAATARAQRVNTRRIRHGRAFNKRPSNAASLFYPPVPCNIPSWGVDARGRPLFQYTEKGEWTPAKLFSTNDLHLFVSGPDNTGHAPSRKGKLKIWIQNTPAFLQHRYPHGHDSALCRWKECPIKKNTIHKGSFRVAFDERADTSGKETDPFHCTGHMHLYCFEQVFDLVELLTDPRVDVQPEDRVFVHEERNAMALARDHASLMTEYVAWVNRQVAAYYEGGQQQPRPAPPAHKTLWFTLTKAHLKEMPKIETEGASRGNIHLGMYMGNLHKYQYLKDKRLQERREARALEGCDDEDEDRNGEEGERGSLPATALPSRDPEPVHWGNVQNLHGAWQGPVTNSQSRQPSAATSQPQPGTAAGQKRPRPVDEDEEHANEAASSSTPARPIKRAKAVAPPSISDAALEAEAMKQNRFKRMGESERKRIIKDAASRFLPALCDLPPCRRIAAERYVVRQADHFREKRDRMRCASWPIGVCG